MSQLICQRILLKLSGEALMGEDDFGINPDVLHRVAGEIGELVKAGLQIGLVIGGGNIFRGAGLAQGGFDRMRGDHMGMLATVMNSLAMQDALNRAGVPARVLSALAMPEVPGRRMRGLRRDREAVCRISRGDRRGAVHRGGPRRRRPSPRRRTRGHRCANDRHRPTVRAGGPGTPHPIDRSGGTP